MRIVAFILSLFPLYCVGQITVIPSGASGSGGTSVYTTSTVGASPLSITAATHGQGTSPILTCFSTVAGAYVQITPQSENCTWKIDPIGSGTVVLTYTTAPTFLVINGGGEQGPIGATGPPGTDGVGSIVNGVRSDVTYVGGEYTVDPDPATVPYYATGAGAPTSSGGATGYCRVGSAAPDMPVGGAYYVDTSAQALYVCTATNTWTAVSTAATTVTVNTTANFLAAACSTTVYEYLLTDGPWQRGYCSSSVQYLQGPGNLIVAESQLPPTSTWTASANSSNNSIVTSSNAGVVTLKVTSAGGSAAYKLNAAFPAAPWTLEVALLCSAGGGPIASCTVGPTDNSNAGWTFGLMVGYSSVTHSAWVRNTHYAFNDSRVSATAATWPAVFAPAGGILRIQLVNDDTNYLWKVHDGVGWVTFYSETKAAWTPDGVLFYLSGVSSGSYMSILKYTLN